MPSTPEEKEAWGLILKGNELQGEGQHAEAIALYDRALELKPDSSWAWCQKGISLHYLHRLAEAAYAFRHALQINDLDETAQAWLRNTLRDMKYS